MLQLLSSLALSFLTLAGSPEGTAQATQAVGALDAAPAVVQVEQAAPTLTKDDEIDEHCKTLCTELAKAESLAAHHQGKADFLTSVANDLADLLGEDDPLVQTYREAAQAQQDLADNYQLQADSIKEELEALGCDCDCLCSKGKK